jgi:hypothetical protein
MEQMAKQRKEQKGVATLLNKELEKEAKRRGTTYITL